MKTRDVQVTAFPNWAPAFAGVVLSFNFAARRLFSSYGGSTI